MDEQEEIQQNNMISNLPLLFANGYPTSLDKISESQLEKFIPFMVQCSLGHINLQGQVDCSEPEWWPEDLPFIIPFTKPKKFNGNWIEKLKEVVLICYQFHKSVFLLRFCNDLSSYEHASLRFINNYNSTTSLFDRRSNKLLVTFRNENMSYDQPQRLRKCLLQQKSKNGHNSTNVLQQMVEPAPFDIYLCDNCDAELYSKEAILVHEKTCSVDVDDDDVILCDTPELCDNLPTEQTCNNILEDNEQRIGFMLNFNLQHRNAEIHSNHSQPNENMGVNKCCLGGETLNKESQFMIIDKKKRISRRNRSVHSVSRCPTIPLSSPAGQLLLRTTKTSMTAEYLIERLERIERFCQAPLLSKSNSRPKFLEKKSSTVTPHCTFKKPPEYSTHLYIFPRRQFSQKRRTENILLINSTLLRRCRPISVRLKKITDMKNKQNTPSSTKLNIKLTRDNSRSSNWKISSCPSTEIIVDTIDLCTSDEDDNQVSYQTASISYITTTSNSNSGCGSSNTLNINTDDNTIFNNARTTLNHTSASKSQLMSHQLDSAECGETAHMSDIVKTTGDASCYQQLSKDTCNNNAPPCLVQIVHNNIDNTTTKVAAAAVTNSSNVNTSVISDRDRDQDVSVNFLKPFRPSVYILSNCPATPLTAIVSPPNLNSNLEYNNGELHNQRRKTTNNSTAISGNWFSPEPSVSLESETRENSGENNELVNNNTSIEIEQGHKNRTLPLIHHNRIVSIDLTS